MVPLLDSVSCDLQERNTSLRMRCNAKWLCLLMISSCCKSLSTLRRKVDCWLKIPYISWNTSDFYSFCPFFAAGLRVLVTHLERTSCCPQLLARLARSTGFGGHQEFCLFLSTKLPIQFLNRGKRFLSL